MLAALAADLRAACCMRFVVCLCIDAVPHCVPCRDVAEALIRKGLLLLPEVDAYLAKLLLQTRTQALGDFAVLLARAVKDGLAGYADVSMSLDLLGKLSAAAGSNEAILQLLSAARQSSRARAALRAGLPDLAGLKDKQDPPGFHQQVRYGRGSCYVGAV